MTTSYTQQHQQHQQHQHAHNIPYNPSFSQSQSQSQHPAFNIYQQPYVNIVETQTQKQHQYDTSSLQLPQSLTNNNTTNTGINNAAAGSSSSSNIDTAGVNELSHLSLSAQQPTQQQQLQDRLNELTTIPLRIALVCQSNLNRSMEAHDLLSKNGYTVYSYGVGNKIRLPGESINKPHIYDWNSTTYDMIYHDLSRQNQQRYTKNGILWMLQRDSKVKDRPERWHTQNDVKFDIVYTFERRVFDQVIIDLSQRNIMKQQLIASGMGDVCIDYESHACHIINIETTDNTMEAISGANNALEITKRLHDVIFEKDGFGDWENQIVTLLDEWETSNDKELLHAVVFY